MAGNVFGLNEVYDLQKDNATDLDLNIPGLTRGYLGGGEGPSSVCTIDRIDFSTETVSANPGQLTQARRHLGAVSSSSFGYFVGGYTTDDVCTIDRLDFSNETVSANPGQLTQAKLYFGTVSNSDYGYFGGGYLIGGGNVCRIDRLDFSTETVAAPGPQLTQAKYGLTAVSSSSYGYFGGGNQPSVCTIDRFDFSTEIVLAPGTYQLTQPRRHSASTSSSSFGYFAGGYVTPVVCTIDRLDFSNETVSANPQQLTGAKGYLAATSSSSFGYFGGGYTTAYICTIDRLDFSTDTVTAPGPQLTQARSGLTALSINRPQVFKYVPGNSLWKESPNYGYYGSGEDVSSNTLSTISKIDFSSETLSNPSATTTTSPIFMTGTQNSNYGYYVNGYDGANNQCTINRFDFSNETLVNSAAKTNRATRGAGGVESKDYAYFGGGYGPGDLSTIDRMDFSTEVTSLPGTFISQARGGLCGSNNENYGYFAGGTNSPIPTLHNCRIDRIDFSTETVTNPPVSLSDDKRFVGGFESQSYGYFAGGSAPSAAVDAGCRSNIDKMDFSSETLERLSAQLSVKRDQPGATSNFAYGYIGGGRVFPPTTTRVSTIDRLDFVSDTISTPSSTLPSVRSAATGISGGIATRRVGKATYGYWAGGYDGSYLTTIDRMEFSTETIRRISGELSIGRGGTSTVSNGIYAYIGGGISSDCVIDRLDFSNDTVVDSGLDFPLSSKSYLRGSVQNSNYGYFCGGYQPPTGGICRIDRLDFSSETIQSPGTYQLLDNVWASGTASNSNYGYLGGCRGPSTPVRQSVISRIDFNSETTSTLAGQLSVARGELTGVENTNYGYFAGGFGLSNIWHCIIDRIDFTTETVSANPGSLTQPRRSVGGSSASEYGYFAGGDAPGPVETSTIDRLDFAAETVSLPSQSLTGIRSNVYSGFENG